LTLDQTLDLSIERLELLATAAGRQRAREGLELSQAMHLAFGGGDKWIAKQRQLIKRATVSD
jgi:hypothetical protein